MKNPCACVEKYLNFLEKCFSGDFHHARADSREMFMLVWSCVGSRETTARDLEFDMI